MTGISKSDQEIMNNLMEVNKLTKDTLLYRFTSEKYLKQNDDGSESIIANNEPIEMLVDAYKGQNHVFIAKDIGSGLSFLTEPLSH